MNDINFLLASQSKGKEWKTQSKCLTNLRLIKPIHPDSHPKCLPVKYLKEKIIET